MHLPHTPLNLPIGYNMHAKVNFCIEIIIQIETEYCAIETHFHENRLNYQNKLINLTFHFIKEGHLGKKIECAKMIYM